ncbi:MAG: hypothetical protein AAGC67_13180, partial [Myxococcota bacterium]
MFARMLICSSSRSKAFALGLLASLFAAAPALALTIDSIGNDRGTFNSSLFKDAPLVGPGTWKSVTGTYFVRGLGDGGFFGGAPMANEVQRNYHIFDLSSVAPGQTILSAELRLTHPTGSYVSSNGDPTELVRFFDISTSTSDLRSPDETQPNSVLDAIFDDLGSGSVYGEFLASPSSDGTVESITLTADAIADLNAAIGGEWAIGGALQTIDEAVPFGAEEQVFKRSETIPDIPSQLVLTFVPEPGTALLLGLGLAGLAG